MSAVRYRLGFDIGGTFTDYVLLDPESGAIIVHKALTDAVDPARGAATGLQVLLDRAGISGKALDIAIHATTLITNALIERKGARTALVTTQGFRDALEIGTELRYDIYDLRAPRPEPLVPRDLRFEVAERMDRDGRVVTPLDADEVRALATRLQATGAEAVAVVLMHAYREPAHEQRIGALLAEALPDIAISLSSKVSPEIREYERTSTTVANAYTQPITRRYVGRLADFVAGAGCARPLHIMVSSGGIVAAESVVDHPIRMLESGPAAGVLAAVHDGRRLGLPDLISFDMGGTTAKIALIKDGVPARATSFEAGRAARFKRGSGLPIRLPVIELIEIGAGGGSIARIDQLGLLQVGPDSAGSMPGPACYGRGGVMPTVTDANLVLGYLDPGYFLGGTMRLDAEAARAALASQFAPIGKDAETAAQGVFEVVNNAMIAAARVHVAERCEDPRRFHLYAFGGAGPAHAYELARALGMKGVVVPAAAGAGSAMGLVVSPVSFELARSHPVVLDEASWHDIHAVFAAMAEEAAPVLAAAGLGREDPGVRLGYAMDLRHVGQGHELTVTLPAQPLEAMTPAAIRTGFFAAHRARFGHAHPGLAVELMTCRLSVTGPEPLGTSTGGRPSAPGTPGAVPKASRRVYFTELRGWRETPVYERAHLQAGTAFPGPAVIEEAECTTIAGPSAQVRVHTDGTLFLDLLPTGSRREEPALETAAQ